ncbi:FAD-binding oxidoreductase [Kocuria palustris]|uniref:FAD-binding oxidoreductase n=1 Tax=Kocuria palustris TaxID=71999 RepID=UPI0011A723B9|nr:FAD-linked oxidase C-terminal domain-containing protein [Kocuria palustris]
MTTGRDAVGALKALKAELGDRLSTDPDRLEEQREDRSGHRSAGAPLALVRARSIEDVQTVCRTASAHGIPVVTRGAGTGLAGGACAGPGEIVLSTQDMAEVLEISRQNRLAVVQPGILNGALNARLAEHGLWWAPDPASRDISTVGGNIAMNAGGLLCAKYGVTRESVLALKVVLADGRLISVGHRTVKGVSGYDLCALMIGSEGTLGVIVECTLALRPAVTGPRPTVGASFPSVVAAAAAASAVVAEGLTASLLELMDGPTVECVEQLRGQRIGDPGSSFLLAQTDGPDGAEVAARIAAILEQAGGTVRLAADEAEGDDLVGLRRSAFPALEARAGRMARAGGFEGPGSILVEDIAVPRDRLAEAFERIREIETRHGLLIPTTTHAGDGNLHPIFLVGDDEVPERIWAAAGDVFRIALELGGTLTGEHGIGLLKRRWLGEELGPEQLELQTRIREAFDPQGILNPGKALPARPTN